MSVTLDIRVKKANKVYHEGVSLLFGKYNVGLFAQTN